MKKVIFITGTSKGIGKAIADFLYDKGYTVIGTSRNPKLQNTDFRTIQLNLDDPASIQNAIQTVIKYYGKMDVLINNAGFGLAGPIEDTSLQEAKQQFETNFFGTVQMMQGALPHMRNRGGGLIINISSVAGLMGVPFQGFYASSKFALEGLVESLRMELKPFNIQVTNINPGDFKTSFMENRIIIKEVSEVYQSRFTSILRKYERGEMEGADPEEIGPLVERIICGNKEIPIRHIIGKKSQTLGIRLKKILGPKIFEKILRKSLGIK